MPLKPIFGRNTHDLSVLREQVLNERAAEVPEVPSGIGEEQDFFPKKNLRTAGLAKRFGDFFFFRVEGVAHEI